MSTTDSPFRIGNLAWAKPLLPLPHGLSVRIEAVATTVPSPAAAAFEAVKVDKGRVSQ
eukprot:SAG22_NODE_30_length_28348_cov_12.488584_24_plen_58_part_00